MKSILNVHSFNRPPAVNDDAAVAASKKELLESVDVALPGEPEHFEPHEVKEPEMDGELIDAILSPFLDRLPGVSDEARH